MNVGHLTDIEFGLFPSVYWYSLFFFSDALLD